MRCLVTGAAGFIGSHLAQVLVAQGHEVVGVDCFTPYYGSRRKEANLREAADSGPFQFLELDLQDASLTGLLRGADVVFHQAGQPGVRSSWGTGFADYARNNVTVTQRLLEASEKAGVGRFIFASSSSVYGNLPRLPATESDPCRPFSPYGVSKLAAENLCTAYADNGRVETVSLRYFTVYGPRQRPDMAFSRFISMALRGDPLPLYAGGEQIRDFTYVDDVVRANLAAAVRPVSPGAVFNIAGGVRVTMADVLLLLEEVAGVPLDVQPTLAQAGDVRATAGDTRAANEVLGWSPEVDLRTGLGRQVNWQRDREHADVFVGDLI
jgi:nucleoside-diphosphate-sugar epimerase